MGAKGTIEKFVEFFEEIEQPTDFSTGEKRMFQHGKILFNFVFTRCN